VGMHKVVEGVGRSELLMLSSGLHG
jgi:hypothetical protein